MDLLVFHDGTRWGFEFKYEDAPQVTKSMHVARKDLGLERLAIVYPGKASYRLNEWAVVVPLADLRAELEPMGFRPQGL